MMCLGSYDDPPQHSTRMGTKITDTLPLPNAVSTGTNICQALEYGRIVLDDSPRASDDEDRKRFLVILSDGDNFWNPDVYVAGSSPNSNCLVSTSGCPADSRSGANLNADGTPNDCAPTGQDPPTNPTGSDPTGCNHPLSSTKRERQLDLRALARADALKTDADDPENIEIYVVALDVCGRRNQPYPDTDPQPTQYATASYCNGIGNANNDSTADRRLLKCIASSSPGTNDHYYEVRSSGELPAIFQAIAYEIAGRGLAVAPAPP